MKRQTLFALMLLAASTMHAQVKDPIIMKVGDTEVTKSEFEYALIKNNAATGRDAKAAKEYLAM